MTYEIELKPKAIKDLKSIDAIKRKKIVSRMEDLKNDLAGDVKRLTNFTPEYRLRVGSYRVLSKVVAERVVIYRIRHRKDAYN
jgi:mRNA interferase RelE/StbE